MSEAVKRFLAKTFLTQGIVEKGNGERIERQRDALRAIVKKIENIKTQIEQAKLESGVQFDELAE